MTDIFIMPLSEILKTVDWIIDIPENDVADVFKERYVSSSIFNMEFKNVTTHWRLMYNLNGEQREFHLNEFTSLDM